MQNDQNKFNKSKKKIKGGIILQQIKNLKNLKIGADVSPTVKCFSIFSLAEMSLLLPLNSTIQSINDLF